MKYAVFTVGAPDMSPETLLQKLKEYGYHGVEWRVERPVNDPSKVSPSSFWENNLCTMNQENVLEEIKNFQTLSDQYGVEVTALGTYTRCNQHEQAETMLKAAASVGCRRIRVSPYQYDGSENYNVLFRRATEDYRVLEKLAKQYGVKINMEIHMNTITSSASSAYRLASQFDSRYIGVIYDLGNLVYEGFEQTKMGLEILGEYLDHVHIKNASWNVTGEEDGATNWAVQSVPLWKGQANLKKALKVLKDMGYDDYISFEDFSTEMSTEEKLRSNLEYIKKIEQSL